MSAFFLYWLPWYFYLALIFTLSSLPRPEKTLGIEFKDYLMHPLEYFLLPFATFQAFRNSSREILRDRAIPMGILFCFFYAASDEFHQWFVPGRHADWVDWLYDGIGIAAGTIFYIKFYGKRSGSLSA